MKWPWPNPVSEATGFPAVLAAHNGTGRTASLSDNSASRRSLIGAGEAWIKTLLQLNEAHAELSTIPRNYATQNHMENVELYECRARLAEMGVVSIATYAELHMLPLD